MKQKLISIHLNDQVPSDLDPQELLNEYLTDGWIIRSITPVNGSGGGETGYICGWVIVLLENDKIQHKKNE